MKRFAKLTAAALVGLVCVTQSNCATLYRWERIGRPEAQKGEIDTGWVILHILTLNVFGFVTDYLTGALWMSKSDKPWGK